MYECEPRWHGLFFTAVRAGLRQGELLALRKQDLDFVKRQIHVRLNFTEGRVTTPKSGKSRMVPMSDELFAVLKAERNLLGELVFSREDGSHLSGNCLWKPMLRNTARAGLPRIPFHGLRHSFASQLAMEGIPLPAIQQYLGHANLSTTMRYAHLSPGAKQGYVNVLDSGWPQSGPNRQFLKEVANPA